MSLVSQSIKNLKGGISQQPDILRFSDQGESQVNAFSSEVEGLQKRPPTVNIKRLGNTGYFGTEPYFHNINRDDTEQYSVIFTGSTIKVIDLLTGNEVAVSPVGNALNYIKTPNPREDLRMVTVADYTFIVNKTKTIAKGTAKTPAGGGLKRKASVQVKGGQYGRTYRITINDSQVAAYETPLGDKPEHAKQIDIRFIMDKLKASFKMTNATCTSRAGGFLEISSTVDMNSLKLEDGYNGALMSGAINDVQKTTDLPKETFNGHIVNVAGDATSGDDDFWVMFDANKAVWNECAKPNLLSNFNVDTMPHILVRQANGTFQLKAASWDARSAGDDNTNPYPSFVDGKLHDVFFFRNRLGFLSGENVVLSEAGSYWNFFPKSVAAFTDADPIDVAVSTNRISILKYAVPFAEELLLWSDQSQFVLTADGVLTASSVRLDMTTEFEITDKARPYGIGRGVYFVAPRAQFSSVRRYYAVQDVTQVKNAEDISAHIPSYIPNGVFKICGSSTENFLTMLSEGSPHKVFFYKFLYLQESLVQQSWSHWDFGEGNKVLSCDMLGSKMYLTIDTKSGIFLERIEFTQNTKDFKEEPFRLYIDRKTPYLIPSGAYNDDTYTTTIHLQDVYGATPSYGDYYVIHPTNEQDEVSNNAMFRFDCPTGGWKSKGTIELDGNWAGMTFYIGEAYNMYYQFSKFLIKNTDTAGGVSTEDIGRLQLRRAWVNYENSGSFKMTVQNQARKFVYDMTGNRLNTQEMILGDESLDTGQFRYPIGGDAKTITVTLESDTPNPVAIIGGGWEGNYIRRSSGI